MTKFNELAEGDHFAFSGQQWKKIPVIRVGSCGCHPQWNAQDLTDENIKTFLNEQEVEKLEP